MSIEPRGTELTAPGDVRIRRALLSVSDKRGLVDFARGLTDLGIEIISTGGTASELADEGIETRAVEDFTGFPEILDGRVKTLNPRIHAGLLAVRSEEAHVDTARRRRSPDSREHRHRWSRADSRCGQELRLCRGRHLPGELRRRAGRA